MQYGGLPTGYPWAKPGGLPYPVEIEVEYEDDDFERWGPPYGRVKYKVKGRGRGRPFRERGPFGYGPWHPYGKAYGKPYAQPYGKYPAYGQQYAWGQLF